FFFSSRRRHTRLVSDWSSDVCSSDLASPTSPQGRLCRQIPAELHCKGFRSAITGKLASLPSHGRRAERRSRKETRPICRFGAKKCPPPPTGYESRVDGRSQVIAFEADIHLLALRLHQAVLRHLWCGTWRSGLARVGPTGGRTRNKGAARRRPRHPRPGPRRSARTISSVRRPARFLEPAQVTPVLGRSERCSYAQRA